MYPQLIPILITVTVLFSGCKEKSSSGTPVDTSPNAAEPVAVMGTGVLATMQAPAAPVAANPGVPGPPPPAVGVLSSDVKSRPGESPEAYLERLEELPVPGLDCRLDPDFEGKVLCILTHFSASLLADLGKLDADRIVFSWNQNHNDCPAFTETTLRQFTGLRHVHIPCDLKTLPELVATLTHLETLSTYDVHSSKVVYLKDLRSLRSLRFNTDPDRIIELNLPSGLTELTIDCPPAGSMKLAPELTAGLRHLSLHSISEFDDELKVKNQQALDSCHQVPLKFKNLESLTLRAPHQALSRLAGLEKLKKLVYQDSNPRIEPQTAEVLEGLPASLEQADIWLEMENGELEKASVLKNLSRLTWRRAPDRFGSFKEFSRLVSLEVVNSSGILDNQVFDAPALEVYRYRNHNPGLWNPFTVGTAAQATKLRVMELQGVMLDSLAWAGGLDTLVELKIGAETKDPKQDLSMLGNLSNLKVLHLDVNLEPADTGFLRNLVNLEELKLGRIKLQDLSFLAALPKLRRLSLQGSTVVNWEGLARARNLQYLNLSKTNFSDAKPLSNMASLRKLDLSGSPVKNLTGLGLLQNLLVIDISSTGVKSLVSLAHAKNLREIHADGLYLDLEPIRALPLLRYFQTKRAVDQNLKTAREMATTHPHFTLNQFFEPHLFHRHFSF